METSDPATSPRKKQKLEMPSLDNEVEYATIQSPDANQSIGAHFVDEHSERAKEVACGITEFVSTDLLGFTGILKKRYTDFLVNEILPSGEVAHLTNLKTPKRNQKRDFHSGIENTASADPQKRRNNVAEPVNATAKCETVERASEHNTAAIEWQKPCGHSEETPAVMEKAANTDAAEGPVPLVEREESHISVAPDAVPSTIEPNCSPPGSETEQASQNSPHKRIPSPSASVSLNGQGPDGEQPEKGTRKRQKVLIRQTNEGWVEVDQEKEDFKDAKTAEDGTAGTKAEEPPTDEAHDEDTRAKEGTYESSSSTQAQWQAFASTQSAASALTGSQLNAKDLNILASYFDSNVVNALVALYDRVINSPHRKLKDYGSVKSPGINRETRSKIHHDVRRIFRSRLESVTDRDGSMIVTATSEKPEFNARTSANNNRNQGRTQSQWKKPSWEELGGDYLHFTLCKENKDTMESISWLSKELKTKPGIFQFAGTKDRRAVTVQRVSVYRILADRMISAGRSLRNAKIGNFEYRSSALQLGELSGNEFVVTLRDCDFHYPMPMDCKTIVEGARSIIGAATKHLSERGFINYYGLQRFGTFSTSTSEVGLKLLQGDFKAAVDAILHFGPTSLDGAQDLRSTTDKISREDHARACAIHSFTTTGNVDLYALPRKYSAESNIIRHLSRTGQRNDYLGALQTIQRNLRLMYVHAYQSLVWNMAASERWKRFGSAVAEGDLVLIDEHEDKTKQSFKTEEVDEAGETIIQPSAEDRASDPEDLFTRARPLSKDEADSGTYTIFDVVLPTPGYDIKYPANEMHEFYKDFMASERGGRLDPHDMRRKWKDLSLSGSYRKFLARPSQDISFDVRVYNDENEQFVETDLDRLSKGIHENINDVHNNAWKSEPTEMNSDRKHPDHLNNEVLCELSDSETGGVRLSGGLYKDFKIAVILRFQLGTSQYATVALRELMKLGGVRTHKPEFSGGR